MVKLIGNYMKPVRIANDLLPINSFPAVFSESRNDIMFLNLLYSNFHEYAMRRADQKISVIIVESVGYNNEKMLIDYVFKVYSDKIVVINRMYDRSSVIKECKSYIEVDAVINNIIHSYVDKLPIIVIPEYLTPLTFLN